MQRTITLNDSTYVIPEMDFEAVCELEEHGVDLLAMDRDHPKFAVMLRGICAWVMDVDNRTASREISEHIKKGGDLMGILGAVTDAMGDSGFFGQSEPEKVTPMPQDHQKKGNRSRRSTNPSQTS